MKTIITIILTIILIVPPVQAHVDVIVYSHYDSTFHGDVLDTNHQQQHHKHDTDDEKSKEHHHHCGQVNLVNAIIIPSYSYEFAQVLELRKVFVTYKSLYQSGYLEHLLQPPRL